MHDENVIRRFIAGATCPECKQTDKIVLVRAASNYWYECIACGQFKSSRDTVPPREEPEGQLSAVKIIE